MNNPGAADSLARLQQENLAAAMKLAELTVEASRRLIAVQLDAARRAVEVSTRSLHALQSVAGSGQAAALRSLLASQSVEQALAYSENLYSVATELQDQFTRVVEARLDAVADELPAALQDMLQADPTGAQAASTAVRGALKAGQAAFDGLMTATRQVSEVARSGVKAASRIARTAATTTTATTPAPRRPAAPARKAGVRSAAARSARARRP